MEKRKGREKGQARKPRLEPPFPTLFTPFLRPFSILCSLSAIVFHRSSTNLNVQQTTGVNFLDFIAHYLPNIQKGAQGAQKGRKNGVKMGRCELP
jgi:hypothetical protein